MKHRRGVALGGTPGKQPTWSGPPFDWDGSATDRSLFQVGLWGMEYAPLFLQGARSGNSGVDRGLLGGNDASIGVA